MNCTLYYSDENYGLLYTATTTTATITTVGDIILAQSLKEIKSTKSKVKGNVIQELGESTTIKSSQQSHDKGKEILMEPMIEFVKPIKRKDQIRLDKEVALKLQVAFDEEERLAREKAKKNRVGGKQRKESKNIVDTRDYKEAKGKDNKETIKLKQFMEIIPDEEKIAIDVIPLSVKEDLEDLYKLIKAKYASTRPVEYLDLLLWGDLKLMSEPHVEDEHPPGVDEALKKKLDDFEEEYQVSGRIVRIKSLLDAVRIIAAHVCINAAQLDLVLLINFK
nr:hypothetical protein [Tanacetum cinerariifolium]